MNANYYYYYVFVLGSPLFLTLAFHQQVLLNNNFIIDFVCESKK